MKKLLAFILLLLSLHKTLLASEKGQENKEELFLKHLPDGRVFAHFEFTTSWNIHPELFVQHSNGKAW